MRQKRGNKIDTTPVQGEGSFVIAKPLTWDELKELQSLDAVATEERAPGFLVDKVLDWNWTGDDDKPLPSPARDPSVIGKLTISEVIFLVRAIPREGIDQGN